MNRSKMKKSLALFNCGIFVAALWLIPVAGGPADYYPADPIDFVLKYTYYEFAWARIIPVMTIFFFFSAAVYKFVDAITDPKEPVDT